MQHSTVEMKAIAEATQRTNLPLKKLSLSAKYQARKTQTQAAADSLPELAASIKTGGLMQNLVVVEIKKGHFEVCAGGRRFNALKLLEINEEISGEFPVPCLVIPAEFALHASFIENHFRCPMHPADEFQIYAELKAQGRTLEEIAAQHGVTPAVVKRRLALAEIDASIIEDFRANKATLDDMMALASVPDHQKQIAIWAATRNSNPSYRVGEIRSLREQEKVSSNTRAAKYVTVASYEKAGGPIFRDLFANSESECFLEDAALLEKLLIEKMQRSKLYKAVNGEGWKWIECRSTIAYEEKNKYGSVPQISRKPTKQETKMIEKLQAEGSVLNDQISAMENAEEDENYDETLLQNLYEKSQKIDSSLDEIEETLQEWTAELKAQAGCILTLDHSGNLEALRGLVRPEDRAELVKAKQALAQSGEDVGGVQLPDATTRPVHSQALTDRLTAHKVMAIQAELVQKPSLVLCVLVANLIPRCFTGHIKDDWKAPKLVDVSATPSRHDLFRVAPDLKESTAWALVEAQQQKLESQIPTDADSLLPWLLQQSQEFVIELLTFIVASSVYRVDSYQSTHAHLKVLAKNLDLDMTKWWQPTAAAYFGSVSKERIVKVVGEVVSDEAATPLSKMKKGEAASAAEVAVAGKGWLPDLLITE